MPATIQVLDDPEAGVRYVTRKWVDRTGISTLSSDAARDNLRLVVAESDEIPASTAAILDAVAAIGA